MRTVAAAVVVGVAIAFAACGGSQSDLDGPVKCGVPSGSCGSGETCVVTFGGENRAPELEDCAVIPPDAGDDGGDDGGDAGDAGDAAIGFECPPGCRSNGAGCVRSIAGTGGSS